MLRCSTSSLIAHRSWSRSSSPLLHPTWPPCIPVSPPSMPRRLPIETQTSLSLHKTLPFDAGADISCRHQPFHHFFLPSLRFYSSFVHFKRYLRSSVYRTYSSLNFFSCIANLIIQCGFRNFQSFLLFSVASGKFF